MEKWWHVGAIQDIYISSAYIGQDGRRRRTNTTTKIRDQESKMAKNGRVCCKFQAYNLVQLRNYRYNKAGWVRSISNFIPTRSKSYTLAAGNCPIFTFPSTDSFFSWEVGREDVINITLDFNKQIIVIENWEVQVSNPSPTKNISFS